MGTLKASNGIIQCNITPRHKWGNIATLSGEDQYIFDLYEDANNYLRLYRSSSAFLTIAYNAQGVGEQTGSKFVVHNPDEPKDVWVKYSNAGVQVKFNGILVIEKGQPCVFASNPTQIYRGTKQDGTCQLDGTIQAFQGTVDSYSMPTADLIEHLDATAITGLSDEDEVATWTAIVGTNATQGTAAKRPLYKTGIQNGLPIVRADGIDDFMSLTGLTNASGSYTFIAAISPSTVGTFEFLFDTDTGRLIIASLGDVANTVNFHDGGWASIDDHAVAGFQLMTFVLLVGGPATFYRDGVSQATDGFSACTIGDAVALFSRYDGTASWMDADLGELLIYNTALDTVTRQQAEAYLNNKWAIY